MSALLAVLGVVGIIAAFTVVGFWCARPPTPYQRRPRRRRKRG